MSRSVLIFAKPPLIGLSKTRLARTLGKAQARRIARMTMAKTFKEVGGVSRWNTVLYTTPDKYLSRGFGGLWPAQLERCSQGTGDLTARLDKGLHEAPRGQVLFIGADAPDVSRALIWQAFEALKTHDAVFGPASDGGFWLFGMHKGARTVSPFGNGVRWSGPHAMADVRANLGEGARVAELPTLIDIDDADDWRAWRGRHNLRRDVKRYFNTRAHYPKLVEGYWRADECEVSELPWPETSSSWGQKDKFLDALRTVQANADEVIQYRELSSCRVCGENNGSREFHFGDWRWPEGFEHYLEDHNVKPSEKFDAFIKNSAAYLS